MDVRDGAWSEIELTVTVKAYPAISTKHRETVCVAGIQEGLLGSASHIRLYPVPFRDLPFEVRFRKWDRIRVRVRRPRNDSRPESHSIDASTIQLLGHLGSERNWQARRPVVDQLHRYSMCELQAAQRADGTSLGLVVPDEVLDFTVDEREADEREEARRYLASQPTLFDIHKADLPLVEAIPYYFRYRFRCADCAPGKSPHHMSIITCRSSTGRSIRHTAAGATNTGPTKYSSTYARSGWIRSARLSARRCFSRATCISIPGRS